MARGRVKLREDQIQALLKLYKNTYTNIARTILDETTASQIRKAKVLNTIKAQLNDLGIDVKKWVEREIPQYYLDGQNIALHDLRELGVDLRGAKGLAPINRAAMIALMDGTLLSFSEALAGMQRNASNIINMAIRMRINATIAEGKLTGDALRTIRLRVVDELKKNGLVALRDRAGRSWSFDRYAETLIRTKSVEARNSGLKDKMISNGYDLVQVSNHRSDHQACKVWEGRILSLTGKTPGYPTLFDAESAGLFHPNCQHAINVLIPELASKTKAYDNPYNYR